MKSSKLVAAIGVGSYRVYWRRERKGKVELQENNKKGKKKGAREGWVPIIGGKGILVFSWIW